MEIEKVNRIVKYTRNEFDAIEDDIELLKALLSDYESMGESDMKASAVVDIFKARKRALIHKTIALGNML